MTHSRELAAAVAVILDAMSLEPLLTADETRARRGGARGARSKS